ncbi:MAG: SIS domain-containing protein [Deltaproteobacteria bacterium]|nr:SIS domain-containing protein [Deltaproteobacteria bacterium]
MASLEALRTSLGESAASLAAFVADEQALLATASFVDAAFRSFDRGGRIFVCGNGGSMSDAMHFAQEWTGRFRRTRRALPAMAFCDPSVLTCIANDFGYEEVFARQIEAHGQAGDLLVAISTSGESANVLRATAVARDLELVSVGLLGMGGGKLASEVDIPIVVPLASTADRIQEVHIQILHAVIEAVEHRIFPASD